ncbi:hypothetical protein [Chlorogloea sp. CCALA 695]|uniref:hypothetical protein n=1 Tax=Chlorogloea sp. CCALA 695 TaxID=2107693 RepID=UPI000D06BD2A|nr:hypothetical protein [Chlorogloea sp. CCALA 695]PSB28534.1 hypothetical protein C7B70_20855 [Chlorogloea sp. CCALA 695]
MKIEFNSELYPNRKISITLPESPFLLRLNKQVGCFATSLIEKYNHKSIETYGRGKWLECAIAKFDGDLHGIVGMGESKQWGFVSAIVTDTKDKRIEIGCLIHFLTYGSERTIFARLANNIINKTQSILEIDFNQSIPTQHKTVIRPPSIYTRKPNERELQYVEAAHIIARDYSSYLLDATSLYPARYDNQNNLISGLIHLKTPTVPKNIDTANSVSLKKLSGLFWR